MVDGRFSIEFDIDKHSPVFTSRKSLAKWVNVSIKDEDWLTGIMLVDSSTKYFIEDRKTFDKLMLID